MTDKTGAAVVAQAEDDSLGNTEPVLVRSTVVGIVTSVLVALGVFGLVSEEQRNVIVEEVGNIAVAAVILLPIIASIISAAWARLAAFSPRSAAQIAVENAPVGVPPTLVTPP